MSAALWRPWAPVWLVRVRRRACWLALTIDRPVAAALYLAVWHHHVVIPDGPAFEEDHQAVVDARSVTLLGPQGSTRDERGHSVPGHVAPRVIWRRRLRVPDVAGVAAEVPLFEGLDERVGLHDDPAGDVADVRAPLHREERLPVEEALRLGGERRGDDDNVALGGHLIQGRVADAQGELLDGAEAGAFEVEHVHVEGLPAGGDELSDLARAVYTHGLVFEVVGAGGDLGHRYVPLGGL